MNFLKPLCFRDAFFNLYDMHLWYLYFFFTHRFHLSYITAEFVVSEDGLEFRLRPGVAMLHRTEFIVSMYHLCIVQQHN